MSMNLYARPLLKDKILKHRHQLLLPFSYPFETHLRHRVHCPHHIVWNKRHGSAVSNNAMVLKVKSMEIQEYHCICWAPYLKLRPWGNEKEMTWTRHTRCVPKEVKKEAFSEHAYIQGARCKATHVALRLECLQGIQVRRGAGKRYI